MSSINTVPSTKPSPIDLTTLAAVNLCITNNGTTDQHLLQAYISSASQAMMRYASINPFAQSYTEERDGNGNTAMVMSNGPIISVERVSIYPQFGFGCFSVGIAPQPINVTEASSPAGPGFQFDDNRVTLVGYSFVRGVNNVQIQYTAGYTEIFPETHTVTAGTVTLDNASAFIADFGVTYNNLVPLTKVTSNPAQGQYTVSATGVYGFNSLDNATSVIITYRYGQIPYDIIQACNEWVAQTYNRRLHVDQDSKLISGGAGNTTVNFSKIAMPREVKSVLDQFKDRFKPV